MGSPLLATLAGVLGIALIALTFVRRRSADGLHARIAVARRRMPATLEAGGSYGVPGPDSSRAYGIFASYLNAGAKGLVLSRLYPDEVRARHPVGSAAVLWLSRGYGRSSVNPTNLAQLVHEIERHVTGREASVVVLEGFEYLVTQNGAAAVARFLEQLTDAISAHLSRLLVPFDPAQVAAQELPLLTRDLRTL